MSVAFIHHPQVSRRDVQGGDAVVKVEAHAAGGFGFGHQHGIQPAAGDGVDALAVVLAVGLKGKGPIQGMNGPPPHGNGVL
jgi:hypothetical protein